MSLKNVNDKQAAYHLRYVGTCKLQTTPKDSYDDDIEARTNGFMASFFRKINEIDPSAVFISPFAIFGDAKKKTNLQEKMFISLFGQDNLLNYQPDGYIEELQSKPQVLVARFNDTFTTRIKKNPPLQLCMGG